MNKIDSLISDVKPIKRGVERIKYMPYSEKIAKNVWFDIARKLVNKDIEKTPQLIKCWSELIKWVHGDESGQYDINKNILLSGRTGSGKSLTMQILHEYIKIDDVRFRRNGKVVPLNFRIFSAHDIVSDFQMNGYEGLAKFEIMSNICIDDLGTEKKEAVHFGNRLNVLTYIIEKRYMKGLTTHFTTNLAEDEEDNQILEIYNSRVHSRIHETCNIIVLNDKDFRL